MVDLAKKSRMRKKLMNGFTPVTIDEIVDACKTPKWRLYIQMRLIVCQSRYKLSDIANNDSAVSTRDRLKWIVRILNMSTTTLVRG